VDEQTSFYAAAGLAAMIPGMQYAIDQMQKQLDEMKARLMTLQGGAPARRGRPPADPEARSREMKRRIAVSRGKAVPKSATHPRDRNHPEHAAWLRKMKRAQKKRWEAMTPIVREAQLATMAAGRSKAAA